MATILIIEDAPHITPLIAEELASRGHQVLRCSGAHTPFAACPMLRGESCILPEAADLIVFACTTSIPYFGRTYRAEHLLAAYLGHETYGRLPFVLVGPPSSDRLTVGRLTRLGCDATEEELADAVDALLALDPDASNRVAPVRIPPSRRRAVSAWQRPRR